MVRDFQGFLGLFGICGDYLIFLDFKDFQGFLGFWRLYGIFLEYCDFVIVGISWDFGIFWDILDFQKCVWNFCQVIYPSGVWRKFDQNDIIN